MLRRCGLGISLALVLIAVVAAGCSESDPTKGPDRTVEPKPVISKPAGPADDGLVTASAPKVTEAFGPPKLEKLREKEPDSTRTDPIPPTGAVSYADVESVFREKRYQEAAALFTRYTEQRPNSSWGHYMRGVSAWKDGDLTQAEEAFGHALLLDPDHVKSLLNLSRVLLEQERFDEALEKTELAREINSTSNAVHRLLARSYYAQGRVDDAVDTYRHAIILDDLDAWSMNNLGLIFFEQRRFEEALPPLARAVELREDVPQFQNNLGMVLEHTGRFVDAAKAYDRALVADQGYDKAWVNLTRVEEVDEDSELEPFDVAATAERFVEDLRAWNESVPAS